MTIAKTFLAIGVTLFTLAAFGCTTMDDPPSDMSSSSPQSNLYFGQ